MSDTAPKPVPTAAPAAPVLCAAGCGFFGNPRTDNFCSKCYKDKSKAAAASQSTSALTAALAQSSLSAAAPPAASSSPVSSPAAAAAPMDTTPIVLPAPASSLPAVPASPLPSAIPSSSTASSFSLSISTVPSRPIPIPSSSSFLSTSASLSASSSPTSAPSHASPQSAGGLLSSSPLSSSPSSSPGKSKKRCHVCERKVGLDGFSCKCDSSHVFCSAHRLPHAHNCTFNRRQEQQSLVKKSNPVVAPSKLEQI